MSDVMAHIISEVAHLVRKPRHEKTCPLNGGDAEFCEAFADDCTCQGEAVLPIAPPRVLGRGLDAILPPLSAGSPELLRLICEKNRLRHELDAAERATFAAGERIRELESELATMQVDVLRAKAALAAIILRNP